MEEAKPSHPAIATFTAAIGGQWQGSNDTWFEPGKHAETKELSLTARPALSGQHLLLEYESTLMGHPMLGHMLIGFKADGSEVQAGWADTAHNGNGVMPLKGAWVTDTHVKLVGGYDAGEAWGGWWTWTIEIELKENQLLVRHFNQPPNGEPYLGVEWKLQRA